MLGGYLRNRSSTSILLRVFSIVFISLAIVLLIIQLIGYSRQRSNYPPGMTIAGVPVGGLDPQAASQRVLQMFMLPIEVQYAGAIIDIDPNAVGFEADIESMLAAADLARTGGSFWGGFWDYLWNREPTPVSVPLRATISEERLRTYLQTEIAARYDQPPTPAQPIPGRVEFTPGQPGQTLDINRAVILIEDALRTSTNRVVMLTFQRTAPTRPSMGNLQILLKQIINLSEIDGVIGLYLLDLQTGEEIHFALNNGQDIPVDPDVAFTASSTAKIAILTSYFIQHGQAVLDEQTNKMILDMISKSENPPTDKLMTQLDEKRGPLIVTEYMKTLGLNNTFIAGFFCSEANPCPLLSVIKTPANMRTDVLTDPDPYNQTTPSDIGMLLEDIYQCAQDGGGALVAVFPDKINQGSCQQIISFLVKDKIGVLIEAGVPEGTQIAHKHGWIREAGDIIHNVSDAAIVYTPGGNYILTIYLYHPVQAIWEPVSKLFAQLSQAVYNYFNLPNQ